jgi:hypothetical protein
MASLRRNSDLQSARRQLQISHALPQFPPIISRKLRVPLHTHTLPACTRRDASQRTARAPNLSSDPETVLNVETASHLATSEPQIPVPRLSETDLPGITHPLLHNSIVPLSVFGVTHGVCRHHKTGTADTVVYRLVTENMLFFATSLTKYNIRIDLGQRT